MTDLKWSQIGNLTADCVLATSFWGAGSRGERGDARVLFFICFSVHNIYCRFFFAFTFLYLVVKNGFDF